MVFPRLPLPPEARDPELAKLLAKDHRERLQRGARGGTISGDIVFLLGAAARLPGRLWRRPKRLWRRLRGEKRAAGEREQR